MRSLLSARSNVTSPRKRATTGVVFQLCAEALTESRADESPRYAPAESDADQRRRVDGLLVENEEPPARTSARAP